MSPAQRQGSMKAGPGRLALAAGIGWWLALAMGLATSLAWPWSRLLLWQVPLGLLLGLSLALAKPGAGLFKPGVGFFPALAGGLAWGAAWGFLNLGAWQLRVLVPALAFAALGLTGRALLLGRGRGSKAALVAALVPGLGLLALPGLFLPGGSRHLASLALATALSAGLVALWGRRLVGQAALVLLSLCLMTYLLELTGTVALGYWTLSSAPEAEGWTRPEPGEEGWRRAKLEQAKGEWEEHWKERCYQGRTISINRYGFRGREFSPAKPANVFRILVTGASVAFGTTPSHDRLTLQGQLERRLNQLFGAAGLDKRAEVYNLALPALTSASEVAILLNLLETRPDLVIMFTGWNDLVFAHEPGYYAEGQLGLLAPGCGRSGPQAPGATVDQTAFGARNVATIPRAFRQLLLLIHERAADSSRGYLWLTGLGRRENRDRPAETQAQAALPRRGEIQGEISPGQEKAGVERLLKNVDRARLLTEAQGGRLLLALQPFRYCGPQAMVKEEGARMAAIRRSYRALLSRLGSQDRIRWLDTTTVSDLMEEMGSFYDSCHFDDEGYALASEAVFGALLNQGLVAPLQGVTWTRLNPNEGQDLASPWALTLGERSEASLRTAAGRTLGLDLAGLRPASRNLLLTGLGIGPWEELKKPLRLDYRIVLKYQAGPDKVVDEGSVLLSPPRTEEWKEILIELDPAGLKGARLELTAGEKEGPPASLHWRRPVIIGLPPGPSG